MTRHNSAWDRFIDRLAGLLVWRELLNPRPTDEEIYRRMKQQHEAAEAERHYQEDAFEQWKSETEHRPDSDNTV